MVTILFSKFICHHLTNKIVSGERGIRTLAPVNPTYTLSRGASSANLSISPNNAYQQCICLFLLSLVSDKIYSSKTNFICQLLFLVFFILLINLSRILDFTYATGLLSTALRKLLLPH